LPRCSHFEVLHRIGDEGLAATEAGVDHRAVEYAAGRAHERASLQIFLVPRLLADQHQPRSRRALAGNDLGGMAIERAARARGLGLTQRRERGDRGKRLGQ
jgi:hypothetical protein